MEEPINRDAPAPWFEEPGYRRRVAGLESAFVVKDWDKAWALETGHRHRRRACHRQLLSHDVVSLQYLRRVVNALANWAAPLMERILAGHRLGSRASTAH